MGRKTLQEQRANDQGTIERSFDGLCVMEPNEAKHSNQAEFERLKEEDRALAATCLAAQTAVFTTLALPELFTKVGVLLAGSAVTGAILKRAKKIRTIWQVGEAIDEAFQDRDVQIFCDLETPDNGRLDLFVRFPVTPKAIFTIALRSQDSGKFFYREDKEAFYIQNKNRGRKPWKPDPIERMARQESWLRQNQKDLFGVSVRDRNRSVIKVLVIIGNTRIGDHPEHLYTQVGDQRVLLIRRKVSIYVLTEDQLIPFLKGWFAQKQ